MRENQHDGCASRRYAGQVPAIIQAASRCNLNLDLGLSGSASSGASGGATQFAPVTIGAVGGSGSGSSGGSTLMIVGIVGAVLAVVLIFVFRKRK